MTKESVIKSVIDRHEVLHRFLDLYQGYGITDVYWESAVALGMGFPDDDPKHLFMKCVEEMGEIAQLMNKNEEWDKSVKTDLTLEILDTVHGLLRIVQMLGLKEETVRSLSCLKAFSVLEKYDKLDVLHLIEDYETIEEGEVDLSTTADDFNRCIKCNATLPLNSICGYMCGKCKQEMR